MEPIGVAQIVHSLEVGGMERVAAHLAMNLSPQFKATVFCLTVKGQFAPLLEEAGIEVVALNKKPGKDLLLPYNLAKHLRERRIRIVHAHNSGPLFTGGLAGKLARVPCVLVTDHSRPFPERRTVLAVEYVLSRLVDEIVSVSEDNRRDLIEKLHWPTSKIKVIANGVAEVEHIAGKKKTALRAEFGLTPEVPTVLTVARLEKQKNLVVLVEAARLLKQRGLPCRFLLAGEGSQRPVLEELIAKYDLGDSVTLAGWRLDTLALYRVADLMALSSDWEGLPMSILEAMSAALPVVATAVGDVAKAVTPGETGLLTPPQAPEKLAEALAELLADPEKRQRFGQAGYRVWQAQFSVRHMVDRYEEIYSRYL